MGRGKRGVGNVEHSRPRSILVLIQTNPLLTLNPTQQEQDCQPPSPSGAPKSRTARLFSPSFVKPHALAHACTSLNLQAQHKGRPTH